MRGRSSAVAKGEAFLACAISCATQDSDRLLLSMQFVPDERADKTERVAGKERDDDENNCRFGIKCFDHIDRLDHVRPKNEVDYQLRPSDQNKNRPEHMPTAD